jgi:carbon monoxide dehydrogenase subunit G
MDLEHSFTVPVGVDEAWAEFQDIASIAECFPGATVTGVEGDTFNGSVKVKLGPIALLYNGSGTFTEKDDAAHRFVVDAKGKDRRGNGTAGATVTLSMDGTGESTDVNVHTDLSITGKPAQFGRGVMQDVSDKLLGQFVSCLEQRLGDGGSATTGQAVEVSTAASPSEAPSAAPTAEAGASEAAAAPEGAREGTTAPEVAATPVAPAAPPPAATPRASSTTASRGADDALDLGRTVLPVLARTYWRQALVALVVIVVIIWLVAR